MTTMVRLQTAVTKILGAESEIPLLQVLHWFYKILLNIISFQHVLHFGVGRSQTEWNMKVKIEISICTGLMLNA